ncbi:MAG: hypothetical protein AABY86_12765, partial [Bdellovibrionota bacterium]
SRGGGGSGSRGTTSAARNPSSASGGKGKASALDGFARKLKNARYRLPIEAYEGKAGGLPGIKSLKEHLPYESPWIVPS